jgi:hypothetical protein
MCRNGVDRSLVAGKMLDRVIFPDDFSLTFIDPTSIIVFIVSIIHGLIALIDLGIYIILFYVVLLVLSFFVYWLVCGRHA